jgi:dTDP-4-dehydrorhamnose reductase
MLGHDLLATAPQDLDLFPFARGSLDITDTRAVAAAVADARPDVIINAAAYTAVDRAESEPDLVFRVNAEAVGKLGEIAARAGARVVHFSTDYVFDGTANTPYTEDSIPNPINAYGASKLAGERALEASGAPHLIVRSQWLFGMHGKSFPLTMWKRANANVASHVVNDQYGRPTHTADLADAVWRLVTAQVRGLVHVTNTGTVTWYDVAQRIYAAAHAEALITACYTNEYPTPAVRPIRAVLDTTHAEKLLGGPLPRWEESLDRFLDNLRTGPLRLSAPHSPELRPPR